MKKVFFTKKIAKACQSKAVDTVFRIGKIANQKSRTSRRSFFKIACIAIITSFFILTGCKKDKDLSPPKWIQGEWMLPDQAEYRFTANKIVFVYLPGGSEMVLSTKNTEETTKTDDEYELIYTVSKDDKRVYNFKKGDGTYIDLEYNNNRNLLRLIKKTL